MSYQVQIKRLYGEAAGLHEQAKAKLKEFEGKTLPADVSTQVDGLLDQVEAKTNEAKRLERTMQSEAALNAKANALPAPGDTSGAGTSENASHDVEAKRAFAKFMRKGHLELSREEITLLASKGFGVNGSQVKALAADEDTAGGYTVANQFRAELLQKQKEASAMRRICRVLPPIPGGSSITPMQNSDLDDAAWTPEVGAAGDDSVKPFTNRALTPHQLTKQIKVSRTLMRASAFDIQAWVSTEMAYVFAKPEENGFINGDGARKPLGLLNTTGLPVHTTVTSNEVHGDDVINWAYRLPARYSPNARVLCNRAFIRKIRLLHTFANGQAADNYLWQPGIGPGVPNRILDWPYELSDRFDDGLDSSDVWEDNAIVAVIGDFNFFWIVDSLMFELQRLDELYAATNQVGFIGRKETDGMAVLAEAFYALKVKA